MRKKKNKKNNLFKKQFNFRYISLIISISILIVLIVVLVFLIKKINEEYNNYKIAPTLTTVPQSQKIVTEEDALINKYGYTKNEAKQVTSDLEKIEITYNVSYTEGPEEGIQQSELYININNVTDKYYYVVSNDLEDNSTTYTYDNAVNNTISFKDFDATYINEYIVKICTTKDDKEIVLKELSLVVPMYNYFSTFYNCELYPEMKTCAEYTFTEYKIEDYFEELEKYESEIDQEYWDKIFEEMTAE